MEGISNPHWLAVTAFRQFSSWLGKQQRQCSSLAGVAENRTKLMVVGNLHPRKHNLTTNNQHEIEEVVCYDDQETPAQWQFRSDHLQYCTWHTCKQTKQREEQAQKSYNIWGSYNEAEKTIELGAGQWNACSVLTPEPSPAVHCDPVGLHSGIWRLYPRDCRIQFHNQGSDIETASHILPRHNGKSTCTQVQKNPGTKAAIYSLPGDKNDWQLTADW